RQSQDALRELQGKVAVIDGRLTEARDQQRSLEAMYQELSRNRDEWQLAEIEQILDTASQQLQLSGNVRAALLAAWARGGVHAVAVSSAQGLANLFEMLGKLGQQWLRTTPVFVPHHRVAEAARQLGVRTVVVAGPGDAEVRDALVAYFDAAK
ncbi:MAG: uroporphyrinogen-III synthase, partial [Burkholderiales bacterium]